MYDDPSPRSTSAAAALLCHSPPGVYGLEDRLTDFAVSALNVADSATGAAAGALDALPVWSFLGPRLIAEACAARAIAGE